MHINSITVRNYRVHRELTVHLNKSLTLIGGSNETGKSTLIEAAHRALFLKAKGTGDAYHAMKSNAASGPPEVEINFHSAGDSYRLFKKFSGTNGVTRLSIVNGKTLQGEEAEARLAELLGADPVVGGRGAGDRASQQWAHLWVWQGKSGTDPTEFATAQSESLLAQLKDGGGAVVMQSQLDARVAQLFAARVNEIYTQRREAKKNSGLGEAKKILEDAQSVFHDAQLKTAELSQATEDFEVANGLIIKTMRDQDDLCTQQKVVEEKLRSVEVLNRQIQKQSETVTAANRGLTSLENGNTTVRQKTDHLAQLEAKLRPLVSLTADLEKAEVVAKEDYRLADTAYEMTLTAANQGRAHFHLAAAIQNQLKTADELTAMKGIEEKSISITEEIRLKEEEAARLPEISSQTMGRLTDLDKQRSTTSAAVEAMATGFELICSDQPVDLAGVRIDAGASRVITEPTEIRIGDGTRLSIRPGNGAGLATVTKKLQEIKEQLRSELMLLGLPSLQDAVHVYQQRAGIIADVDNKKAHLKGLGAELIGQKIYQLDLENARLLAEIHRREGTVTGEFVKPATLHVAMEMTVQCEGQRDKAEIAVQDARTARSACDDAWKQAIQGVSKQQAALELDKAAVEKATIELAMLCEQHGDDVTRESAIKEQTEFVAKEAEELNLLSKQLKALQPKELLDTDTRLRRAISRCQETLDSARQLLAVARHKLVSNGVSNPEEALATARAKQEAAQERYNAEDRRARAAALLHDLFQEEQKNLSTQFSQPFVHKIREYLRRLFGGSVDVRIQVANNGFTGLELIRTESHQGAIDFQCLSAGAKEQLAAAVRLAIAEILAEGSDGCLPVVFDDSFTYSDPERVRDLQAMLDLAATRGLQVIVLSCNPSDYAGLGAETVLLTRAKLVGPEHSEAGRDVLPSADRSPESRGVSKSDLQFRADGMSLREIPSQRKLMEDEVTLVNTVTQDVEGFDRDESQPTINSQTTDGQLPADVERVEHNDSASALWAPDTIPQSEPLKSFAAPATDPDCARLLRELATRNNMTTKAVMRDALGWDADKLEHMVEQLIGEGRIRLDRTKIRMFLVD